MTQDLATPRPWFAVNDGTKDEPMWSVKAARIAGKPPRHEVAVCATGDSPQPMETANAALIVRCVNSHDALVEALSNLLENPLFQVGIGGNPHAVEKMLDQARAALTAAKATP